MLQAIGPVTLQSSTLHGSLSLAADGTGRLTGRFAVWAFLAFFPSSDEVFIQHSIYTPLPRSLG
jgi:hypothetical protein